MTRTVSPFLAIGEFFSSSSAEYFSNVGCSRQIFGRTQERRSREIKLFARVTITWPKPVTTHDKSLAHRVIPMYIIDIKALYICLLFCFLLSYRDSETDGDSYVRKSAKGLTILRTQSEYLSYCCSRIASPRLKWHMSSKQTKKRRRPVEQSTPLLLFPQFPFPSDRVRNIAVELAC